ncbi:hypothetical protein GLYMA_06G283550v4 [Glycine max]|nr:hypothetical protein GLYMA_06G283550v4 [Glycine max]KAH1127971.1 hypothetical protein GYH30_016519 [Glycine max]
MHGCSFYLPYQCTGLLWNLFLFSLTIARAAHKPCLQFEACVCCGI